MKTMKEHDDDERPIGLTPTPKALLISSNDLWILKVQDINIDGICMHV